MDMLATSKRGMTMQCIWITNLELRFSKQIYQIRVIPHSLSSESRNTLACDQKIRRQKLCQKLGGKYPPGKVSIPLARAFVLLLIWRPIKIGGKDGLIWFIWNLPSRQHISWHFSDVAWLSENCTQEPLLLCNAKPNILFAAAKRQQLWASLQIGWLVA